MDQVFGPTVRPNCDYGPRVRPKCDNGPSVRPNQGWARVSPADISPGLIRKFFGSKKPDVTISGDFLLSTLFKYFLKTLLTLNKF